MLGFDFQWLAVDSVVPSCGDTVPTTTNHAAELSEFSKPSHEGSQWAWTSSPVGSIFFLGHPSARGQGQSHGHQHMSKGGCAVPDPHGPELLRWPTLSIPQAFTSHQCLDWNFLLEMHALQQSRQKQQHPSAGWPRPDGILGLHQLQAARWSFPIVQDSCLVHYAHHLETPRWHPEAGHQIRCGKAEIQTYIPKLQVLEGQLQGAYQVVNQAQDFHFAAKCFGKPRSLKHLLRTWQTPSNKQGRMMNQHWYPGRPHSGLCQRDGIVSEPTHCPRQVASCLGYFLLWLAQPFNGSAVGSTPACVGIYTLCIEVQPAEGPPWLGFWIGQHWGLQGHHGSQGNLGSRVEGWSSIWRIIQMENFQSKDARNVLSQQSQESSSPSCAVLQGRVCKNASHFGIAWGHESKPSEP